MKKLLLTALVFFPWTANTASADEVRCAGTIGARSILSVTLSAAEVQFAVKDDGPGIAPHRREEVLLTRFARGDGQAGGSGAWASPSPVRWRGSMAEGWNTSARPPDRARLRCFCPGGVNRMTEL